MAFSTIDLLPTVIAALLSTYPAALDGLGVHYLSTRLGVAPEL
jgi:hypothetical protein